MNSEPIRVGGLNLRRLVFCNHAGLDEASLAIRLSFAILSERGSAVAHAAHRPQVCCRRPVCSYNEP